MTSVPVRPLIRVVANGRRRQGSKSWLKFTLVATPEPASTDADAIEFNQWPSVMSTRINTGQWPFAAPSEIRLYVRPITQGAVPSIRPETLVAGSNPTGWFAVTAKAAAGAAFKATQPWQAIAGLWRSSIAGNDPEDWQSLSDDIKKSLTGTKRKASPQRSYAGTNEPEDDGAILFDAAKAPDDIEVSGVLPIRQSDFAIEEEGTRALRIFKKMMSGPSAVVDSDEALKFDNYRKSFQDVVNNTNRERERTADAFKKFTELLKDGTTTTAPQPAQAAPLIPDKIDGAPKDTRDKTLSGREMRRATHKYGTWLQRRYNKTEMKNKLPTDEDRASSAQKLDRIRGCYFALQGDPVLSRLFCLTFDFEVDEAEFKARVPGLAEVQNLHLAVAMHADRQGPAIATAAKLHVDGFWPVSVFEAQLTAQGKPLSPSLAEQADGIWNLGAKLTVLTDVGVEITVPRYELTALDLRRSVDAKAGREDRGEAHHTGGLTVLDRGRAEQIARDLALADLQAEVMGGRSNETIVLHAEELTIGRHIDVAAAAAGAQLGTLQWRSLQLRYVDFDFGPSDRQVEAVLALLYPDRGSNGQVEEISFQVAARMMPIGVSATSNRTHYEAIAEEAIFQWDGTPAAVLTESGADRKQRLSQLPFGRTLDLLGIEMAHRRPAPLRFSVPYIMRCRSMFLGGGSPDAADHDTNTNTLQISTLPAARDEAAMPRRFLRHESIAAPVLLLPARIADERLNQMGYPQADQAIIRSWNDTDSGLSSSEESDFIKGTYVSRRIRTVPDETIRILVAPEASYELVVRHGKLDVRGDPKAAKDKITRIRKGGLLDVSYTPAPAAPAKNEAHYDKERPSGFPVVVTQRRDTFDPEGAIYRRIAGAAEDFQERGAPVFQPGGQNTTKDGQIGYLPDPAIDSFSIRARIRGSDRYLTGSISVPLYDGVSYPNALPLAVRVVKLGFGGKSVRPAHPTNITEIATLVTGSNWIGRDGKLVRGQPAAGTRVQLVRVELYPGEDFDLEIAGLPTAATLANQFSVLETIAIQLNAGASDAESLKRIKLICGEAAAAMCEARTVQSLTGLGGGAVPQPEVLQRLAAELLNTMQTKWPIEELAAVTRLRVCHAVNKPAVPPQWAPGAMPKAIRKNDKVKEPVLCEDIFTRRFQSKPDATDVFLEGVVHLDLGQIDGFQIIAETTAPDGAPLDSFDRGRSLLSKRSGRWPVTVKPGKNLYYVPPANVVGFKVAQNGVVALETQSVTLLNVGNLPGQGSVGELVALETITDAAAGETIGTCRIKAGTVLQPPRDGVPGAPVFGKTEGRLTPINIGPLFAAAFTSAPVAQQIGLPANALDGAHRTRELKIDRPHVFKDTRARQLKLKLVGISRFASTFETAPAYVNAEPNEQALYRRQPLKRQDQAVLGGVSSIWMQSTRAPTPPDMRRPEPSFVIERSMKPSVGGLTHAVTRRAMNRLYMGRGWYSSGEGERLAIVLWPTQYKSMKGTDLDRDRVLVDGQILRLDNFEDADLGDGGAFVTRWGGDPIRKDATPQSGYFIPPEAFADFRRLGEGPHKPQFVESALLPILRAPVPAAADAPASPPDAPPVEYLPVSLLTFEPCFDLDREEWYVDVDLKPIRASEPFVRFGLARYQEQSISEDLKLSEPVTVSMQLLPERLAMITEKAAIAGRGERDVCVEVSGLGSVGIKELDPRDLVAGSAAEMQTWMDNFEKLQRPKVTLRLFHEAKGSNGDLFRTPLRCRPATSMGSEGECELIEPEVVNATLVWNKTVRLDQAHLGELGPGTVVAYLEEIDRRMPASYRNEPINPAIMFSADTFVDSGPRFSARIPFMTI